MNQIKELYHQFKELIKSMKMTKYKRQLDEFISWNLTNTTRESKLDLDCTRKGACYSSRKYCDSGKCPEKMTWKQKKPILRKERILKTLQKLRRAFKKGYLYCKDRSWKLAFLILEILTIIIIILLSKI